MDFVSWVLNRVDAVMAGSPGEKEDSSEAKPKLVPQLVYSARDIEICEDEEATPRPAA